MTVELFVLSVVGGLLAGGLAGLIMKSGPYGLIGDLVLGLVGSVAGGWIFQAVGISSGAGKVAVVVVAFVGAAFVLFAQRQVWHRPTLRPRRRRSVASGAWRVEREEEAAGAGIWRSDGSRGPILPENDRRVADRA